ncbi:hypothetical protein [Frondihabitans sp. PhB188]|uniref:hypothetical protein n=1 Tax=Frondihabitans sp. PhB188 TaxID=2485200 RepID=UPI001F3E27CC|nr:hypothetical protein [Frondihabitans sp. PhB188]
MTVDPESPEAGLALFDALQTDEGDVVGEWTAKTRPALEPAWAAQSSRWNTVVELTVDELHALNESTEALLEPFINRSREDQPQGVRPVRLLRYVLPGVADPHE